MASITNSIREEIGLQAISEYLSTPEQPGKQRYIVFTGRMMELKIDDSKPSLTTVTLEPNLTVKCLDTERGLIRRLYLNKMHSPSINDSLHPNDLQAKSDIASRYHLVLEDARTLEDLPGMAETLDFVSIEETEANGMPIPSDTFKPKPPLHKKLTLSVQSFLSSFTKKRPSTQIPQSQRDLPAEFASNDSGISTASVATPAAAAAKPGAPVGPVHTPSEASRKVLLSLQRNFEHFTRLLQPLEQVRVQLTEAKDALRQISYDLDRFSTDILENKDFDKILDEKKSQSSDLFTQITTLEQELTDLQVRKNDLKEFFRDNVYALRNNEEFQRDYENNDEVANLLDRLETIGIQQDAPLPRAVPRRNPLETIQEKRQEITQHLDRISNELSIKTNKKDPTGLLFSWNIETNSIEVESKFTLFGTAKVFIPINADGTGIYCKEGSEREFRQFIEVIAPNREQKEGAVRHSKDALYETMQRFARKA